MPVGSPVCGSRSTLPGTLDPKIAVDSAKLECERVERGVGPGCEQHGVFGRGLIELGASRVALFLEPGDENLADDHPSAGPHGLRAGPDVVEHIRDRLHVGHGVIEFRQAGVGRVGVRIDQPGQDHLAGQVDHRGARPARRQHVLIGADANADDRP